MTEPLVWERVSRREHISSTPERITIGETYLIVKTAAIANGINARPYAVFIACKPQAHVRYPDRSGWKLIDWTRLLREAKTRADMHHRNRQAGLRRAGK